MAKKSKKAADKGMALQEGEDGALVVDMSGVDENASFPVLPKGTYPCVIAVADYEISSNGNPMWSIQLEVEEGEHKGQKLFTHIVFSEKALPLAKKAIMEIKPELLNGPFNPETVAGEGELLGTRCNAIVEIKPYEGRKTNNVKRLTAPGGDGGEGGSDTSFM